MYYSFVIPVYNRPDEVAELLESLKNQSYPSRFEVVVVEDGSAIDCKKEIDAYKDVLQLSYYYKKNSGPGDSRNYGMHKAVGEYFIILDSDCILPDTYLETVDAYLKESYVDCFGGPDRALDTFTPTQKAINYAMTSVFTTGGIRGGSERLGKFQPRSFNMGISKKAFLESGGFDKIHPGEDPDLTLRLWDLGYDTELFPQAYVFHKRRIDWRKFYIQVNKFGKARPILNKRHPKSKRLTYWFPTVFIASVVLALLAAFWGYALFIWAFIGYFAFVLIDSSLKEKSIKVGFLTIIATLIQFYGYGTGFAEATLKMTFSKRKPEEVLPEMFFK